MSLIQKTLDNVGNVVNKAHVGTATMGLEAQKKAQESAITQTLQNLKAQREGVYSRIGQKCYELQQEGEFSDDRFSELFDLVGQITANVKEEETRLENVKKKFEEEINLLKGSIAAAKALTCPKCNASYVFGRDLFCSECGEDLRKAHPQCPGCGQEYDPAVAKFCKKCGQSLAGAQQ